MRTQNSEKQLQSGGSNQFGCASTRILCYNMVQSKQTKAYIRTNKLYVPIRTHSTSTTSHRIHDNGKMCFLGARHKADVSNRFQHTPHRIQYEASTSSTALATQTHTSGIYRKGECTRCTRHESSMRLPISTYFCTFAHSWNSSLREILSFHWWHIPFEFISLHDFCVLTVRSLSDNRNYVRASQCTCSFIFRSQRTVTTEDCLTCSRW